MAAIAEEDLSRFLVNPFSVYVAAVGDSRPAVRSFQTLPEMTFSFPKTFIESKSYRDISVSGCTGVLYTVRQDLQEFGFNAQFSIQDTTIVTMQLAHGGTISSDGDTLTLDGTVGENAFWFRSCFADDGEFILITIPKGKNTEASEFSTGTEPAVHPNNVQSLPEMDDDDTLPTIFIGSV